MKFHGAEVLTNKRGTTDFWGNYLFFFLSHCETSVNSVSDCVLMQQ